MLWWGHKLNKNTNVWCVGWYGEGGTDVEMMSSETHFAVEIEPSALGWAGTWVLKKDRNNTNRGYRELAWLGNLEEIVIAAWQREERRSPGEEESRKENIISIELFSFIIGYLL